MKKTFSRIIAVFVLLSVLIAVAAVPASASDPTDIYLRLDGIEGESKNASHNKWIDILSITHGSAGSGQTGSSDTTDAGNYEPVVFKHLVDKATPKLQEACMKGARIGTAQVDYCSMSAGAQTVVYSVKMEGIKVIKAEVETEDLADGSYRLVETVYLSVEKLTWEGAAAGTGIVPGGKTQTGKNDISDAPSDNGKLLLPIAIGTTAFAALAAVILCVVRKKKKTPAADSEKTE